MPQTMVEAPACSDRLPSPRRSISEMACAPIGSDATQWAAACNLVELRGGALKNYEVAHVTKSTHAATMAILDRRDPVLNREVNQFGAAAKSVHLHHLVLVEFDSSRGNRKIARDLLRRTPLRKQLQNLSLA
jgi:hypothetical protein